MNGNNLAKKLLAFQVQLRFMEFSI